MVENTGPGTVKYPTLTDAVPAQIENPEYSTDDGVSWKPWPRSAPATSPA
jgi:hypothetical protein